MAQQTCHGLPWFCSNTYLSLCWVDLQAQTSTHKSYHWKGTNKNQNLYQYNVHKHTYIHTTSAYILCMSNYVKGNYPPLYFWHTFRWEELNSCQLGVLFYIYFVFESEGVIKNVTKQPSGSTKFRLHKALMQPKFCTFRWIKVCAARVSATPPSHNQLNTKDAHVMSLPKCRSMWNAV